MRIPGFVALIGALCFTSAVRADPASPPSVRELFGNPPFESPRLSSDGQTVAVIHSEGDVQIVITRPVAGGALTPIAKFGDPHMRLSWLDWANDSRLLLSGEIRRPDAIGVRARGRQLFGIDRDGKNLRWLGKNWPRFGDDQVTVQFEDDIVHWTPDDPEHVLIQFDSPMWGEMPDVRSLNVNSGALSPFQGDKPSVRQWYADHAGNVRAAEAYPPGNIYRVIARVDPKDDFEVAIEHPTFAGDESFLGFHEDPAKIYVLRDNEGRSAIFEFDLRTKKLGALVFARPDVDVDGLLRAPAGDGRVIGYRYITDSPQLEFIEAKAAAEYRGLQKALSQEFGGAVQIEPVSRSRDGQREVLAVSSDTQPPAYFVFDRKVKQLFALLEERPTLAGKHFGATRRVTYQARDGLAIPAYLTLPPDAKPEQLPLVVLVHGGPWSRDWIHWDAEVQLFATRGFAVLQPNFRGSTGLGTPHLEAGYREWGQKIQDDITDGVKWAVAQGIADADRVGIYGGSFGGYAALAGAVKTPDLYRATAAFAPVTDIEIMLSDDKWYDTPYDWAEKMVGGGRGDADRLRAASPLRHAAEFRIPVLIGHGVDDPTVHVRQSQRMAKALRDAGKDVTYLEFPDEIHGFSLESNALRWYEALIAFFEKNLAPRASAAAPVGGAKPAAADAAPASH